MNSKKIYPMIFLVLMFFVLFNFSEVSSDEDDEISGARIASLGSYPGVLVDSNEDDFFNFSVSNLRTFNVTLVAQNNSELFLFIYDTNGTLIESTFTSLNKGSINVTGHNDYIVLVTGPEEFVLYPANYTLVIEELVVGGVGDSIANPYSAKFGENNGTLTNYQDKDFFNITLPDTSNYNISLVVQNNSEVFLTVYSNNGLIIASEFTSGNITSTIVAGAQDITIKVQGPQEFILYPANYTLLIIDPNPTTTVSLTSNTSFSDESNSTVSSDPVFIILALISIPILTGITKKR